MRERFPDEPSAPLQATPVEGKMRPATPVPRNLHQGTRTILIELPTAEMSLTHRPTVRMGLPHAAQRAAESRAWAVASPTAASQSTAVAALAVAAPTDALEAPPEPESGMMKVAEAHARLAEELVPGDVIGDGRYRLLERLSGGSMAHVYKAIQLKTGKTVAMKVLLHAGDERARKNAKRELEALVRASHPNVVSVLDADLNAESGGGNLMWIATEFVDGETLRQRLVRGGRLPLAEALDTMVNVFDGLAAAHEAQVLHLDLKPENILRGRGFTKICDLGTAALLDSGHRTTDRGGTVGTPEYIAPERLIAPEGAPMKSDFRCDLYSAGLCLYEIIAGFHALIPEGLPDGRRLAKQTICLRQLEFTPNVLTSIPTALWELIEELIRKDPQRRPSSASSVAQRLRGIRATLHVMPADLEPPAPPAPAHANVLRSVGVGVAAGALGFVVLGGLALLAGAPLSRAAADSHSHPVGVEPQWVAAVAMPRARPNAAQAKAALASPAPAASASAAPSVAPSPIPQSPAAPPKPTVAEAPAAIPERVASSPVRPTHPRARDLHVVAPRLPSSPRALSKLPPPRPKEISDTPPF